MKIKPLNAALLSAGVLVVSAAGAFSLTPSWLKKDDTSKPVQTAAVQNAAPPAVPMISAAPTPNYRQIVKQFGPAVVGITASGTHAVAAAEMPGLPPGAENDPFFQFFKGIPGYGQGPQGRNPRGGMAPQPFRGQGSGFIISEDGLILTNAHVVREAKEVIVKLSDRREFAAKVLGVDAVTDVAVLRIDAKDLPVVRLGDPKRLDVGDPVMAIGSPFGFEQSATQGIVSAKGRSLPGDAVVPFIQTDVAVNPGNSGGPLFDGNGEVVGINAQIFSHTGGYQGLSFAIPINVALNVKDQIVATGKATHGRLGVMVQDLNQQLAESFGLQRPDGALVSQIAPESAAAAAGLKAGDVITHVNGQVLPRSGALSNVIGMSAPGEKVELTVWRNRASIKLDAKLGSAEAATEVADAGDAVQGGQLGLALRPLNPGERAGGQGTSGLVVERVSGPAARAGIEVGDVLVGINGKPVSSIEQIQGVLKNKPKSVALLVQRDSNQIFVPVPLG
ncbi:MAG: Do family serine endopeptidase [Rubrivivax sp.]